MYCFVNSQFREILEHGSDRSTYERALAHIHCLRKKQKLFYQLVNENLCLTRVE